MKKLFYILFILYCCPACNLLDVTPENQVTYTNYFETEQELESITYQMHSFIEQYLMKWDWPYHEHIGSKADETDIFIQELKSFSPAGFSTTMPYCDWHDWYSIIYVANTLLDNIHRAKDIPRERLDFHIGQACFGKGLSYFFIVRHFGNAVLTNNSLDMSIYGNSPATTILDTIISNGQRAWKLLPKYDDMVDRNGTPITSKQFGNKGSAATLVAHAYAWKGSIIDLYGLEGNARECYEQAIQWATKVIEDEKTGNYYMEDPETMCATWSVPRKANPESIFEIELDEITSTWPQYSGYGRNYMGWPVDKKDEPGMISQRLLRLYNTTVDKIYEDNDLRKQAFFYTPKPEDHVVQTKYAYPYKWRNGRYDSSEGGEEAWVTLDANTVYWRLADIILLRAECYAKLDNEGGAKADLNRVRARANASAYPNSKDRNIKDAIFREREKELIFEGHRYYDIIRNGMEYITSEFEAGQAGLLSRQNIIEGILYYPISEDAFTLNDLLRQNSYWLKHSY